MAHNEELMKKLLVTFQGEAEDHLRSLASLLIALEKESGTPERQRIVEDLYRKMHTLKGAAQAVNLLDVGDICQSLESLLAALKRGEITLEVDLFDNLHAAVDSLGRLISPPGGADTREESSSCKKLVQEMAPLREIAKPVPRAPTSEARDPGSTASGPAPTEKRPAIEFVKVPVRILETLLLQAEELIAAKLMAAEVVSRLSITTTEFCKRRSDRARAVELAQTVRRQSGGNEVAGKLAAMVETRCDFERYLENSLGMLETSAEKSFRSLSGMVDTLLDDMKKVHLLPFLSLIEPFHKIIRDTARDLGKQVELTCSGEELEIDRRILDQLKEPLLHILRNVIDHGIEQPEERQSHGKAATGKMVIADDGRGIDLARVKAAAINLELLAAEEAEKMADSEALQLIFESGISTSPLITSLSGRGLGLAIVRESLEKLGGHVLVSSQSGSGTEFCLGLPLAFATIRGLLVETCGRSCLIPAANVEQSARVPITGIRTVENRETINVYGQAVSLARLADLLELPGSAGENPVDQQPVVILSVAEKRIAIAVDQIVGVQEVLAKPLGKQLSRVRNVSGATVLGNGSVVPILNVNDLLRTAINSTATVAATLPRAARAKARQLSVLVAEDSITSRTLLKNILEASGFRVKTAIDGSDALSLLKTEGFDIVVSDVEMPRMDGFELTAAIRRDKRLADLPVVLVTGMESREDREHGIDVGANAYIVKSSFDQSRLIEVIRKLT